MITKNGSRTDLKKIGTGTGSRKKNRIWKQPQKKIPGSATDREKPGTGSAPRKNGSGTEIKIKT